MSTAHWLRWLSPFTATLPFWAALGASPAHAQCKAAAVLTPGDHSASLEFEGISHELIIHVPPAYDGRSPVPLVFDIHGSGSDAEQQLLFSGFPAVADANNFIVVAPTGYMNSWNGDIAFGPAYEQNLDDVGFMKALVNYVSERANINRARVYATGLSNGAAMSNTLGCQAADVFAGIAPVADPLDIGLPTCMPTQPIAVIGFHGYDDEFVPYEGGPGTGPELPTPFPSIPETLKAWGDVMGCSGTPEVTPLQGKSKCEIYQTCGRSVQVGYCSLEGGHLLYWQDVMNIADYAWTFLSQFTLPVPDTDGDGVSDQDDNCVHIGNPDQADVNENCIGDACECETASDCDDKTFCNGSELCMDGRCEPGAPPCGQSETCDDSGENCVRVAADAGVAGDERSPATSGAAGAVAADHSGMSAAGTGPGNGLGTSNGGPTHAAGTAGAASSAAATMAMAMATGLSETKALGPTPPVAPPAETAPSNTTASSSGCAAGGRSQMSSSDLLAMIVLGVYARRRRRLPV